MRYLYSILCIIYLIFTSCQKQSLLSVEELQKIQEEIIEKNDKKLDAILQLSEYYDQMDKPQKAEFGLSLFNEMYKKHWLIDISEKLEYDIMVYIDFSIRFYKQTKNTTNLLNAYILKGYKLTRDINYTEATYTFLEALDADKKKINSFEIGNIHQYLGRLYSFQDEFEKALENYSLAIEQFEISDNMNAKKNLPKLYLLKGFAYNAIEQDHKAISEYLNALQLNPDSIPTGDLYLNLGKSYSKIGEVDSGLFYLYESLKYPYLENNIVPRLYEIAKAYNILNQMDSSYVYINKAFEYPMNVYFKAPCYSLLIDMAAKTEDPRILEYRAAYNACNDSIKKINSQPSASITEQIYRLDKQTIQAKNERTRLIIILSTLSLLCILTILWLFQKQKRKKREANVYKQKLEYKEDLINNQQEEFEKKHQQIILKLKNELKQTKEKYAVERAKGNYEQRMKIDKTIFNEVLNIEDEKAFTIRMNHILNNLPDKLKIDYPNITFKEIVWCCLFIIELPTPEIAFILDYKQTSLYKFKQRLTKKLGFSNVKDLEQMLYNKVNLYI